MSHKKQRNKGRRRMNKEEILAVSGVPTIRAKGIASGPAPKYGCAFWNWGNRGATPAKPRRQKVTGTFATRVLFEQSGSNSPKWRGK